MSVRKNQ